MIAPLSNPVELSARYALARTQSRQADIFTRLSTGKKINRGKDGPAALISTERLRAALAALEAENRALRRQESNAAVTDGHTAQLAGLMTDLRALVVSSANQAGMSDAEIQANQLRVDGIVESIRRFTGDAVTSLDGVTLPGDGNTDVADLLNGAALSMSTLASGGANNLWSGNLEAAAHAVSTAILDVVTARGTIGAYQKDTLEPRVRSNEIAIINTTASKSRIADTDYAVETSNLIRSKILTAAGIHVLRMARHRPRAILDLLSS